MEVRTPGEVALGRRLLRTGAVAVAVSALLVAPAFLVAGYARVGAAAVLAVGLAAAGRAVVAGVVASRPPAPPPPPEASLPPASVVLTAYEAAEDLPATVDACLDLAYPADRLEVVVGYEAASTDRTAAVARAAARDPRVTAVEREAPPAGKASALNHALEHASGEVVAVLDANQRPEPGALRRAVGWLDDGAWCLKGRCFGTNPGASLVALGATVERAVAERVEFYARDRLGGFAFFTGGQAFFRAEALAELGGFDESVLLEDLDAAYRVQRAGGEVRVDPGVVTFETNPETLSAWWCQRARWARGGMQVARRYLRDLRSGPPPLSVRADAAATLGGLLALAPAVLASPLVVLAWWRGSLAGVAAAVVAVGAAPVALAYLAFVLDARDGYRHRPREYAAPALLWPYFAVEATAVVAAFVEEFLRRRPAVYVTSARADGN